jgi:hypothetical protein
MNSEEWGAREPSGGNGKKRDWIPFVSLGVFQATMILAIAGIGFNRMDRLEDRIDRLDDRIDRLEARMEQRLDDLDRRVSRIEGVLLLRAEEAADAASPPPADGDPGNPVPEN